MLRLALSISVFSLSLLGSIVAPPVQAGEGYGGVIQKTQVFNPEPNPEPVNTGGTSTR